MLYFGSGLWKAANPVWQDGLILESTFHGDWSTPVGFWIAGLGLAPGTWKLLAWGVIASELVVGLGFLFRRSQPWAMLAAAAFHLFNTVVLSIPEFLVCICIAPIFASDRLLRAIEARFDRLRSPARGSP